MIPGFVFTLLRMLPGIGKLVEVISTKWMDTKADMYAKRMGVTKEVAVEAIRAETINNQTKIGWLNAVASSRFLQFVVGGFAFPLIVYFNKAIVWDKIVHKFIWGVYGFTPGIEDVLVGSWAGIIISGIFVTGTGMSIAGAVIKRVNNE